MGELLGSGKILILAALLIAGGLGLYYIQKSGDDSERQNHISTEIDIDTLSVSERPVFTAQKDTHDTSHKETHETVQKDTHDTITPPPPVGQDFAPGTALIRGTIFAVEYADDQLAAVEVRVDEVIGYGPSTPPLPVGTELFVDVSNYVKAEPEKRDQISDGEEMKGLISFQQGMRMGESGKKQRWTLVELQ